MKASNKTEIQKVSNTAIQVNLTALETSTLNRALNNKGFEAWPPYFQSLSLKEFKVLLRASSKLVKAANQHDKANHGATAYKE